MVISPNYNANFLKDFTPAGPSNDPRYPHNESTPTSAPLRNTSIFHCCTNPNPFFREYPSDNTEQTFPSLLLPSQTTFSHQLFCPQTTYGSRSLQHGAMGRRTQGSPLSFPTPPINHIRGPSASMGLSHGNNGTAFDLPMHAMNDYMFPNFAYNAVHGQDQYVFSGTNWVINDVQQIQTSIPGKKRSSVGAMDIGDGISDANMKFNNRQHPRSLSSTGYPMPVRNTSKRICVRAAEIQIQSSTGNLKASDSTSAGVKQHSTYSPSVSVDRIRWHCHECEYTAEREQDMIRHCSTLRHGGRRFFSCPSCGKKFSRKDSVTRHSKNTGCGLRRAQLSGSFA